MSLIKVGNFGIFIGSVDAAHDIQKLRSNNIIGILDIGSGNTKFYKKIRYSTFEISDTIDAPIEKFFDSGVQFIDLVRQNGSVLVISKAGISRSSAIVVAWLMQHYKLTLNAAMTLLRQFHPSALPNSGFIKKLM